MPVYASTVISGDIGEADVLASKQMADVTPGVFKVYRKNQDAPTLAMQMALGTGGRKVRNVLHTWHLKDEFPRWDNIASVVSGADGATAGGVITVDNPSFFRVGNTLMFFGGTGGDTVYATITAKASGTNQLTLVTLTGGNLPTLAADNRVYRYADNFEELSSMPTELNVKDRAETNYIQFMRYPVTIGIFEAGTAQYTGDEMTERKEEQWDESRRSTERTILWGERGNPAGPLSRKAYTARGIGRYTEALGGDNVLDWDGVNLTQAQWDDWLMESTKYGSEVKLGMFSAALFRKIHSFSETKDRINAANSVMGRKGATLGINFVNYMTPEGKIIKMHNHHLIEDAHAGFGQIIDQAAIDILPFADYPLFSYHPNVHDPDLAGISNEYWVIFTLEVKRPEWNALIRVV